MQDQTELMYRVSEMSRVMRPEEDGITHINVGSQAKTELGKMLSNPYRSKFTLKEDGEFYSIEAYWYYLLTGSKYEELRTMSDFNAKQYAANLPKRSVKLFAQRVSDAIDAKIDQNFKLRCLLRNNELILEQYVVDPKTSEVRRLPTLEWVIDAMSFLEWELRQEDTKAIVAGSRTITDKDIILNALIDSKTNPREIVSGLAKGVDSVGLEIAEDHLLKTTTFAADWDTHGKSAGFIRNKEMGDYADVLIAIWDGKSSGTKNMIDYMQRLKKPVHVTIIDPA